MNRAKFKRNAGIIIGNAVALAGIAGWGYFIWCLCNGLELWEKVLAEAISYGLVIGLSWYCTLPGAGCVSVKVLYDYRDKK